MIVASAIVDFAAEHEIGPACLGSHREQAIPHSGDELFETMGHEKEDGRLERKVGDEKFAIGLTGLSLGRVRHALLPDMKSLEQMADFGAIVQ